MTRRDANDIVERYERSQERMRMRKMKRSKIRYPSFGDFFSTRIKELGLSPPYVAKSGGLLKMTIDKYVKGISAPPTREIIAQFANIIQLKGESLDGLVEEMESSIEADERKWYESLGGNIPIVRSDEDLKLILNLRQHHSLRETAEIYSQVTGTEKLSRERIRQLEKEALKKFGQLEKNC